MQYFIVQNYDDNPDYENTRQQFINLQEAQRTIQKKDDDIPVAPVSGAQIRQSLSELKQGDDNKHPYQKKINNLSVICDSISHILFFRLQQSSELANSIKEIRSHKRRSN